MVCNTFVNLQRLSITRYRIGTMAKNQGDGVKESRFAGDTQYNTPRAQGGTEGISDRVTGNQDSTLGPLSGEYGM